MAQKEVASAQLLFEMATFCHKAAVFAKKLIIQKT